MLAEIESGKLTDDAVKKLFESALDPNDLNIQNYLDKLKKINKDLNLKSPNANVPPLLAGLDLPDVQYVLEHNYDSDDKGYNSGQAPILPNW